MISMNIIFYSSIQHSRKAFKSNIYRFQTIFYHPETPLLGFLIFYQLNLVIFKSTGIQALFINFTLWQCSEFACLLHVIDHLPLLNKLGLGDLLHVGPLVVVWRDHLGQEGREVAVGNQLVGVVALVEEEHVVLQNPLLVLNSLLGILLKGQSLVTQPKVSRVMIVFVFNGLAPQLDRQVALRGDARRDL